MKDSVSKTADLFKALGDATRLRILQLIAAKGNNLCVGIIAQKLGISQPAVSQHLRVLKNAGLVEAQREGFYVHYCIVHKCLDMYGIPTGEFLRSIAAEISPAEICEQKGKGDDCDQMSSQQC